jgi:hypothetical protein
MKTLKKVLLTITCISLLTGCGRGGGHWHWRHWQASSWSTR